jgi:hypothetical protein
VFLGISGVAVQANNKGGTRVEGSLIWPVCRDACKTQKWAGAERLPTPTKAAVSSGFQLYLFLSSNQIPTITHHLTSTCGTSGEMGFLGLSKRSAEVHSPTSAHQDVEKADQQHQQPTVTADKYESDTTSDTLSLEARNERGIEEHPDQVTADAHIGVQKAEAAALVWGKPALVFIYLWYHLISSRLFSHLKPYSSDMCTGYGWSSSCSPSNPRSSS